MKTKKNLAKHIFLDILFVLWCVYVILMIYPVFGLGWTIITCIGGTLLGGSAAWACFKHRGW